MSNCAANDILHWGKDAAKHWYINLEFFTVSLYPQIIFVKDIKLKSDINIMETNGDIYGRSMGIIKDIDQFREGELLIPV